MEIIEPSATNVTTLPTDNGVWTVDDDLQVFRRIKKILDQVPDPAWARVRDYLAHVLRERGEPPAYLMRLPSR